MAWESTPAELVSALRERAGVRSDGDAALMSEAADLIDRLAAQRGRLVNPNTCPACNGTGEGDAGDCPCAECDATGKRDCSINPLPVMPAPLEDIEKKNERIEAEAQSRIYDHLAAPDVVVELTLKALKEARYDLKIIETWKAAANSGDGPMQSDDVTIDDMMVWAQTAIDRIDAALARAKGEVG